MYIDALAGPNNCVIFGGGKHTFGYGEMRTARGKKVLTHRLAYSLFAGEIPPNMVVRHICDNPPCINPYHLLLGTQADNVKDCVLRGRNSTARGEASGVAKLSDKQVTQIRKRYIKGSKASTGAGTSSFELAKEFGVCSAYIVDLANTRWRRRLTS